MLVFIQPYFLIMPSSLAGILAFQPSGLGSYSMKATTSYSYERLVAAACSKTLLSNEKSTEFYVGLIPKSMDTVDLFLQFKYSMHSNTGIIQVLNGQNVSGSGMVWILNGI